MSLRPPRVALAGVSGGGGRPAALEQELLARARRWAETVAAGPVIGVDRGVGATVARLFASGDAPVLVAWPQLVHWRPEHAGGALDDLADGCELSLGPMFDGGFYLVAFARPVASLLSLPDEAWQTRDPVGLGAAAVADSGMAIGLLRAERGSRTDADRSALRADPLLDAGLRQLLG